jgi:hypothetical protein
MLGLVPLVLSFLAVGLNGVLADFKFTVPAVEQCEPVTISFNGSVSSSKKVPFTVLVAPLDSVPISIPIPNTEINSTGVVLSFIPLAAGTTFVVSLDDATGSSAGKVSSLLTVQPSPTGNSACLISTEQSPRLFSLQSALNQCGPFTVAYGASVSARGPSVRAFYPRGTARIMTPDSDSPQDGLATYTYTSPHGSPVILMFDDGKGHRETTGLLTVGGDNSSDSSCLIKSSPQKNNTSAMPSSPKPSKVALVAIAASATAAVGGIVGLAVLFTIRRRRRRLSQGERLKDGVDERGGSGIFAFDKSLPNIPDDHEASYAVRRTFVQNPPYTTEYPSSSDSSPTPDQEPMWENLTQLRSESADVGRMLPAVTGKSRSALNSTHSSGPPPSISSQDIDYILDIASVYDRKSTDARSLAPASELTPSTGRTAFPVEIQEVKTPAASTHNLLYAASPSSPPYAASPSSLPYAASPSSLPYAASPSSLPYNASASNSSRKPHNRAHSGSPSFVPRDASDPTISIIFSPNTSISIPARNSSLPISVSGIEDLGVANLSPPNLPPFPGGLPRPSRVAPTGARPQSRVPQWLSIPGARPGLPSGVRPPPRAMIGGHSLSWEDSRERDSETPPPFRR